MSRTRREFDVIVLGLGGIGSAAAYWLSRRLGADVLGLEQFPLGHDNGGSQDHSRIIRLSYHTPGYVRLAQRAYASWRTLEDEAREELILITGGLDLAPRGGAIPIQDYADSLTAVGVPFERLDAAAVRARWPQFHVADDVEGLFQEQGGIAKAALANAAHQRVAREHGAALRDGVEVTGFEESGGEVSLHADGATFRAETLVITAGAWSNEVLAHAGISLPLEVTQEQVTYFDAPDLEPFRPGRFPAWIWLDEPCFYGLPVFGVEATKIAQDVGGRTVTTATRSFDADAENLARVERFARRLLPAAYGPPLYTKSCLYTLTPDRDFVIDAIPGRDRVLVAIGAGHAFKFASLIGRVLAELAVDGETPSDIEPFRIDRPTLQMADPPRNYMT